MPHNNQYSGRCKQSSCIRFTYACLAFALILFTSFLAIAIFATVSFIKREPPDAQCPDPYPTPSFLQIQVLGDSGGNNSPEDQTGNSAVTHTVTVNMEKPSWVDGLLKLLEGIRQNNLKMDESINKLTEVLQKIQQVISSDDSRTRNVVLNPEKNEALINALKGASRPQPCLTGTDKHPRGNGEAPTCNVAVKLEEPPWVDDLLKALHGVVEFYAIDPAIRALLNKHLKCDDSKPLSVPGLIRFQSNEHSPDLNAQANIDDFVARIDMLKNKWGVFGFASEEGNAEHNRTLSWQRACKVTKHIAGKHNCTTNNLDCSTLPDGWEMNVDVNYKCTGANGDPNRDFLIKFLGEQHFINGVADSRSVVIAACKAKE